MYMNYNDWPKALFRVRYHHDDDHEGTYREVVVDNMTQVKNMREIHRVVHVDVAVPYWAPLDTY
jgi:hypothetical protein